jgi:hypothetical protein
MAHIKSHTVFSTGTEKDTENKKLSYWLEKLHIQGEKVRKDENRRELKSKVDEIEQVIQDQVNDKKYQDTTQSGIDEHEISVATKKEDDIQAVSDLVKMSNRSIISISSQFPWDFLPNTIDVEESRVTFKFNQLLSSQSHSVDIKDISNVFIESSMFFASLQVVSRTFIQNDIKIGYLNKAKAENVQKIIEGLRTFSEHNINTSDYEINELIAKIEEFHSNPTSK